MKSEKSFPAISNPPIRIKRIRHLPNKKEIFFDGYEPIGIWECRRNQRNEMEWNWGCNPLLTWKKQNFSIISHSSWQEKIFPLRWRTREKKRKSGRGSIFKGVNFYGTVQIGWKRPPTVIIYTISSEYCTVRCRESTVEIIVVSTVLSYTILIFRLRLRVG